MAILKIKAPTAWDTIPAGLAASGDVMALARIEDSFNDGSLNTINFGALTAANGTVKENEALELNSPAAIDAAAVYLKTAVSKVVKDIYTYRWRPQNSTLYPFLIQQNIGAPIIGNSAAIGAIRVAGVYLPSASQVAIFYIDNVGSTRGWNGSTWIAGGPIFATVSLGTLYESQFEVDDANARWRIVVKNITDDIVMTTTDWVTWAATRDTGSGELWFGSGDFYNDIISGKLIVSSFRNQFKTAQQVTTMGEIAGGGAPYEQLPITDSYEAGASGFWEYNLNQAGFVKPGTGTLAEVDTALTGAVINFFDLRWTVTSDGEGGGSFDINGGAIACPSATCDFPAIGKVTEGTIFDNGNLTGTYKEVPEPKAEFDFDYGAGGVEFTGELSPFQASYELPEEVILEDPEIIIFEGCD